MASTEAGFFAFISASKGVLKAYSGWKKTRMKQTLLSIVNSIDLALAGLVYKKIKVISRFV